MCTTDGRYKPLIDQINRHTFPVSPSKGTRARSPPGLPSGEPAMIWRARDCAESLLMSAVAAFPVVVDIPPVVVPVVDALFSSLFSVVALLSPAVTATTTR